MCVEIGSVVACFKTKFMSPSQYLVGIVFVIKHRIC
jgi:hypothetical protein